MQAEPENQNQEHQSNAASTLSRTQPPTLLRVYADNQDKRAICIFWAIFFIVLVIITGASFGRMCCFFQCLKQLSVSNLKQSNCNPAEFNNNVLSCYQKNDRVGILLTNLERQNQFAVIFIRLFLNDPNIEPNEMIFSTKLTLYEIMSRKNQSTQYFQIINTQQMHDHTNLTFHPYQAIPIYQNDDSWKIVGYMYPAYVLRNFNDQSFDLVVETNPNITDQSNVNSLQPLIMVVNPEFTTYSIVIRYVYFVLSLVGVVLYGARFMKIPKPERIVEQKMIMVLSVLLIFFNDPFYPVTVLYPNRASSYFSALFIITFIIFLFFVWIIFIDRILYQDGKKVTELINWKRVLYIVVFYIFSLVLYTELAIDHIQGLPIVPTEDLVTRKFLGLEIIVLLLMIAGSIYIFAELVRICRDIDSKMWRNQLFMFFTIFFLFTTLVMFFLNGFRVFSMEGNRILLIFTQMNMYTFYLQYMYSVTSDQRDRLEKGIIYGSQRKNGGDFRLLDNGSEADWVDLQFKDSVNPGPIFKSNQQQSKQQKRKMMQEEKNNEMQFQAEEIEESEKQTDFFKEEEHDEKKKKDDFEAFSLD